MSVLLSSSLFQHLVSILLGENVNVNMFFLKKEVYGVFMLVCSTRGETIHAEIVLHTK